MPCQENTRRTPEDALAFLLEQCYGKGKNPDLKITKMPLNSQISG
jgi:hypothetical protein